MKYLYYIIGIFILLTAAASLMKLDKASVEVSKPAIVINDRIITESELNERMASKPHDMTTEQYIDSLIMKELLIQEALKSGIHKEESFRKSVENYYEQSLVKILLDRKYGEFRAEASDAEIQKYKQLIDKEVFITKKIYKNREDAEKRENARVETINSPFEFLSDRLKFILLHLETGIPSEPMEAGKDFVTYTLEKTRDLQKMQEKTDFNITRVKTLITDQKKERLYEQWAGELKEKADIWRGK